MIMKDKKLTIELENEEYEDDDDWTMDDDDPYYGLPGIDPEYEEWLCDIGEDPWGGHWSDCGAPGDMILRCFFRCTLP